MQVAQGVKVEPINAALREYGARVLWRRVGRYDQTQGRQQTPIIQLVGDIYHVSPMADWPPQQIESYKQTHNLISNHDHWDIFKPTDQQRECGINQVGSHLLDLDVSIQPELLSKHD